MLAVRMILIFIMMTAFAAVCDIAKQTWKDSRLCGLGLFTKLPSRNTHENI